MTGLETERPMIELNHDELRIHFPEVHEQARLVINFQRTLRIPDDGRTYPLPAWDAFRSGTWTTMRVRRLRHGSSTAV